MLRGHVIQSNLYFSEADSEASRQEVPVCMHMCACVDICMCVYSVCKCVHAQVCTCEYVCAFN